MVYLLESILFLSQATGLEINIIKHPLVPYRILAFPQVNMIKSSGQTWK